MSAEKWIEAGARAIARLYWCETPCRQATCSCEKDARASFAAILAAAEADGVVMTRVPGEARNLFGPPREARHADGWNNCRAATLAGKVVL